uniref:Kringle domain-containing protein n=1 Tax=Macrostomum lignano TaxID=282301 RepID=A0A1I8FCK5_9PLAT
KSISHCRSNPSSINFVPWCVTNVGGTPTPSNCSIPFCSQVNPGGCRTDRLGTSYRGNQSTSVTGKTCIRWDSAPGVYTAATWPVSGETISAANNLLQKSNNSPVGLWCLVSTTDWEPCVVPVCAYRYKDLITVQRLRQMVTSVYFEGRSRPTGSNSKVVPPATSSAIY